MNVMAKPFNPEIAENTELSFVFLRALRDLCV